MQSDGFKVDERSLSCDSILVRDVFAEDMDAVEESREADDVELMERRKRVLGIMMTGFKEFGLLLRS